MAVRSKQFIGADEIAETLEMSRTYAYTVIKKLNAELAEKGYLTVTGKVPRKYFNERYYAYVPEGATD